MRWYVSLFVVLFSLIPTLQGARYKEGDCEVCVGFLRKLISHMEENGIDSSNSDTVEREMGKLCDKATNKEERFCYYIGASVTSATRLVNEVTRPLASSIPPEKICFDKLRKKDASICELRYEKEIDLDSVDLNKLRVRDLRKVLTDLGETCNGCVEKSEFVDKIKQLRSKMEL